MYTTEVAGRGPYGPDFIPIGSFFKPPPKFRLEVCGSCGLTDWFIAEKHLEKVREKFTPLTTP